MEQIIAALLSNDNKQRKQAENLYQEERKKNPSATFEALLHFLLNSQDSGHKSLSLVLLRRQFIQTDGLYKMLSLPTRSQTKEILLRILSSDEDLSIRKKCSHLIATVAKEAKLEADVSQDDGWKDLLQNLISLINQSSSSLDKIGALYTLTYLAEFDPDRILPLSKDFCVMMNKIMLSTENMITLKVKIEAFKACCSLLQSKEVIEQEFQDIVPSLMIVISQSVKEKEEVIVQDSIKALLEVLEKHPRFLKANLSNLVTFVTQIIGKDIELEEETKSLSLELVCSVAEKAQIQLRSSTELIEKLLNVGMEVIASGCYLETLTETNEENEDYFDNEEDFRLAGEDMILRLSKTVGNQIMLPIAFTGIENFLVNSSTSLSSSSWQYQVSAIRTISLVSQKGGLLFFEKIENIVNMILGIISNTQNKNINERTIWTGINCLATFYYSYQELDEETKVKVALKAVLSQENNQQVPQVEDLSEEEEEKLMEKFYFLFNDSILKTLTTALNDTSNASYASSWKIKQEMCATLLALFSVIDSKELIKPYEEELLKGLFNVIQNSPNNLLSVKVEGLTTVSGIANNLQKDFGKYYDHFMPIAKQLINFCLSQSQQQQQQGQREQDEFVEVLRGKAMDCVGLLGASVSKEKFDKDAREVLDLFIKSVQQQTQTQSNSTESLLALGDYTGVQMYDSETQESKEYIIRACARIITTMGYESSFSLYLMQIIPGLVKMAAEKVNISIFDPETVEQATSNQTQKNDGTAGVDINVRGLGEKRVEFNTFTVQDKELSLNMLFAYSDIFQEYFLPFSYKIYQIILPELISPMYSIRLASTFIAPKVLNSLCLSFYLMNNLKSSYDSSNNTGDVLTDAEWNEKQLQFKNYLQQSNVNEAELSQINLDLIQGVFDDLLMGLLEGLEYSIEEEEEFIHDEIDLFEEEDEESEMFLIAAESLASLLRLSFESGGLTDNKIDKILSPDYQTKVNTSNSLKPMFYVKENNVEKVLTQIIRIMKTRIEKRLRMVNVIKNLKTKDDHLLNILSLKDKKMNEFLDSMSEAIGCLIKTYSKINPTSFISLFETTCHPFAYEILKYPESFELICQLKSIALFFYDDLIEFLGYTGKVSKYVDFILPYMLDLSNHSNYLVRQAACFGFGCILQYSQTMRQQQTQQSEGERKRRKEIIFKIYTKLVQVINGTKAKLGANLSATDNAISSLYKLCIFHGDILSEKENVEQVMKNIINYLPLKNDLIEAKTIHLYFIKHIQNKDKIGSMFYNEILTKLKQAMNSKKGYDKETEKYYTHSSILTKHSRNLLQGL